MRVAVSNVKAPYSEVTQEAGDKPSGEPDMQRYFIDTFDGEAVIDEKGQEFADLAAVRHQVHDALAVMMRYEPDGRSALQFRADVRDESGLRVMTATLLMVIEETR